MNETLKVLRERRSIRKYKKEQVAPETLDAILDAGTWAASAKGGQSAVMVVVQDPETIAYMSALNAEIWGKPGVDPFFGAPTVVVVLADGETANWLQDGSLVMGNLMTAAWSLGVGSCWVNRRNGACRRPTGAWATASWGISTAMCPPPSPGKRATSSARKEGEETAGCPPAASFLPKRCCKLSSGAGAGNLLRPRENCAKLKRNRTTGRRRQRYDL